MRRYIKRHAYGNTVSDDLWREIEAAAGKPITAIAHDFTLQPGVPLVTLRESACVNGATRVTLAQGEFSRDEPDEEAARLAGPGPRADRRPAQTGDGRWSAGARRRSPCPAAGPSS